MIPERRRAQLPPGHWYLVHQPPHGRLIVTVSTLVPPNSDLEQELVRDAVKAWRHHQRRGLVLLPAPIAGGAGLGWVVRQLRRPTVAAGAAVATVGVAFAAVVLTEPPQQVPHRPPAAAAPPSRQPTRPPHVAPSHPAHPPKPGKTQPRRTGPGPVVAVPVSVGLPARPRVRLPRVPPVRVRPPVHVPPVPPVTVTPPSPVSPAKCRLVRLEVGRLVHICL